MIGYMATDGCFRVAITEEESRQVLNLYSSAMDSKGNKVVVCDNGTGVSCAQLDVIHDTLLTWKL